MAPSSPTNHDRVAAMKARAAQVLASRYPTDPPMLAKELVKALCQVPALDWADAVQAVTELIDEGKLSFHWMEGPTPMSKFVFGPKYQYELLDGRRPAVTFDYCFVRVEDFHWLRAATSTIAATSEKAVDDGGWPTVSRAAREQGVTPDVITKAANSANLRTNGKTGRDRRIDPASLIEWSLKRADA